MKSFDDWFKELTSDTLWYELLRAYRDTTIKEAGKRVYANCVADGTVDRPMSENRKHVYNILCKNPGDKVVKPWYVQEAEEKARIEYEQQKDKSWVPITGEDRLRRLKEWEAIVKGSTMANSMPKPSYKQLAEEGGVLPPKPTQHPVTSPMEYYIKERHLAYIEENYDPRTGDKLPTAIEESLYNLLYDEKNYKTYAKVFGL